MLDFGALRAEHGQAFERVNSLSESRQTLGEFWLEGSIGSHKAGVGLVLDASGVVQLSRITILTDTPGFRAEIRATNIQGGPTQKVSDDKVVGRTTRFQINQPAPKRFYGVVYDRDVAGDLQVHDEPSSQRLSTPPWDFLR